MYDFPNVVGLSSHTNTSKWASVCLSNNQMVSCTQTYKTKQQTCPNEQKKTPQNNKHHNQNKSKSAAHVLLQNSSKSCEDNMVEGLVDLPTNHHRRRRITSRCSSSSQSAPAPHAARTRSCDHFFPNNLFNHN